MSEYFYGEQSEQFSFYRMPKALVTDPRFKGMSTDAKFLYGLFLDRMGLSMKNGWYAEDGRVYIIFSLEEIMEYMNCAEHKGVKLLKELENFDLIQRKKLGQGKPSLIFVKNFLDLSKSQVQTCQNRSSALAPSANPELPKAQSNNTEMNKTEYSKTYPIDQKREAMSGMQMRQEYHQYFVEKLAIESLLIDRPTSKDAILGILELLVDTCCSSRAEIMIAGDVKPIDAVRNRFLKLGNGHIRYVLDCMGNTCSDIRNIRQYLLAALYNAPTTMSSYYLAKVNCDLAQGVF